MNLYVEYLSCMVAVCLVWVVLLVGTGCSGMRVSA